MDTTTLVAVALVAAAGGAVLGVFARSMWASQGMKAAKAARDLARQAARAEREAAREAAKAERDAAHAAKKAAHAAWKATKAHGNGH